MLLGEHDEKSVKKEMLELVMSCQGFAKNLSRVDPNFWNRIHVPDATMLHALINDDLTQQQDAILDQYVTMLRLGASDRERRTVIDHFTFLSEMLRSQGKTGNLESLDHLRKVISTD